MTSRLLPRVTLFHHPACQLCLNASAALTSIQSRLPANTFTLERINIHEDGNEKWKEVYGWDVPVIHLGEERVLMHRIGEGDVERVLRERGVWPAAAAEEKEKEKEK
ncbi:hypothetical protein YB2330_002161 [Saitoella coloradoensis]